MSSDANHDKPNKKGRSGKNPPRSGHDKNIDIPLPETLRVVTLDQAIEALADLDRSFGIVPDTFRQAFEQTVSQIRETADRLDYTQVTDVLANASTFLTAVTGITTPTAFKNTEDAAALHPVRNLMLAICLAGAANIPADPRGIYARVPQLKARTTHRQRPLTDDEITLARVAATVEFRTGVNYQRPTSYTACDAGMVPVETTTFCLDDIDRDGAPVGVLAHGHATIEARHITLDQFASRRLSLHLGAALAEDHPVDSPILYAPRKPADSDNPNRSPSASSTILLTCFLDDLGLKQNDVTASSIRAWRLAHIYLSGDPRGALELSGFPLKTRKGGPANARTPDGQVDWSRLRHIVEPALPDQAPTIRPSTQIDFNNPFG